MGDKTEIAWTDHTFNAWIGCTKVSEGCRNCYAATRDARHMQGPVDHWGAGAPRQLMSSAYWAHPQRWAHQAKQEGRRHKVFCASMADIFDAEAPVEARRNLWVQIMLTSDWLDWQLLTKRPERIQDVMGDDQLSADFFERHHCWLMTSTENQAAADLRIPELLLVRAAVHGISAEPLLGPVWLGPYISGLDWVIAGGESGPGARPMHPRWARSLRDQCLAAGVAFFHKQNGEFASVSEVEGAGAHFSFPDGSTVRRVGKHNAGAFLEGVEWRQFPEVHAWPS